MAFGVCYEKLKFKSEQDENLVNNEDYQANLKSFTEIYTTLRDIVKGQFDEIAYKRVIKNEEHSRIRKMVFTYVESFDLRKYFKKTMNLIYYNFEFKFPFIHLKNIL